MFVQAFNPSALTTVICISIQEIDDYYSESLCDYLYANFFHLHKDKIELIYVGNEDSQFSDVADVIRCEMYLNKVSVATVEVIHADLTKITEDWLVNVGGYESVQP